MRLSKTSSSLDEAKVRPMYSFHPSFLSRSLVGEFDLAVVGLRRLLGINDDLAAKVDDSGLAVILHSRETAWITRRRDG